VRCHRAVDHLQIASSAAPLRGSRRSCGPPTTKARRPPQSRAGEPWSLHRRSGERAPLAPGRWPRGLALRGNSRPATPRTSPDSSRRNRPPRGIPRPARRQLGTRRRLRRIQHVEQLDEESATPPAPGCAAGQRCLAQRSATPAASRERRDWPPRPPVYGRCAPLSASRARPLVLEQARRSCAPASSAPPTRREPLRAPRTIALSLPACWVTSLAMTSASPTSTVRTTSASLSDAGHPVRTSPEAPRSTAPWACSCPRGLRTMDSAERPAR